LEEADPHSSTGGAKAGREAGRGRGGSTDGAAAHPRPPVLAVGRVQVTGGPWRLLRGGAASPPGMGPGHRGTWTLEAVPEKRMSSRLG
jgi:hypothetical protein